MANLFTETALTAALVRAETSEAHTETWLRISGYREARGDMVGAEQAKRVAGRWADRAMEARELITKLERNADDQH